MAWDLEAQAGSAQLRADESLGPAKWQEEDEVQRIRAHEGEVRLLSLAVAEIVHAATGSPDSRTVTLSRPWMAPYSSHQWRAPYERSCLQLIGHYVPAVM